MRTGDTVICNGQECVFIGYVAGGSITEKDDGIFLCRTKDGQEKRFSSCDRKEQKQ